MKYINPVSITAIFIIVLAIMLPVSRFVHEQEQERMAQLDVEKLEFVKKQIVTVNTEHVRCLALNIYHEAGGEPFMGQVAVARVVMNRVKHGFASNPCKVIYQTTWIPDQQNPEELPKKVCQFSWVCEGKPAPNKNNPRYQVAEKIAHDVLAENRWHDQIPSNLLFFHNNTVNPGWVYHRAMAIGNHVFYSKGKPLTVKTVHSE